MRPAGLQAAERQRQGDQHAAQLGAGRQVADPGDDRQQEAARRVQEGSAGPPVGHLAGPPRVQPRPAAQRGVTAGQGGAARLRDRQVTADEVVNAGLSAALATAGVWTVLR